MHLEQLPSGSWRVTVRHQGHRRRATAPTRTEAQIVGGRLLEQLGAPPGDGITLSAWLRRHVDQHRLADTTRDDYTRILDRLATVDHPLSHVPVDQVTTARLVALYDDLAQLGWTPHRVSRLHEVISGAYTRAVRLEVVARNPARGAAPARPPLPQITPPTDADVARLIDAAGDFTAALLLAASTGMRRGELVGIQWGDIDFAAATITIRRAVTWTARSGTQIKDVKNGVRGERVIALDPATLTALRTLRTTQLEQLLALGLPMHADRFVFARRTGEPWRPDFVTYRFAKLRTELGLDHVRLYDVRHWMITSMLAAGEPVATVAGRAGHDPVTMLRRYWHFVPASDRDQADRHAARLAAAREKR